MYICGQWYLLYCTVDCQRAWVEWNSMPTQKDSRCHLLHIYILPPDDGLLIRPKHVEV
jgi:hypothetical protein